MKNKDKIESLEGQFKLHSLIFKAFAVFYVLLLILINYIVISGYLLCDV